MGRLREVGLGLAAALAVSSLGLAQRNPRGSASLNLSNTRVTVEYGRPSLLHNGKERSVQSMLSSLPDGDFWRLGADKSTTFTTSGNLQFGDVAVPKGEYSLWVQKQSDNTFALVFNKQHGQWGTMHDPKQDFAKVPLKQEKESASPERVKIDLEKQGRGGELTIHWGDMELSTNFTAK